MEGELIYLGFIMLIGQIILMQMWNSNWFKKENFKLKKKDIEGEIRLRHKKLERDLGLKPSKASKEEKSPLDNIGGWIKVLRNLDPEKLGKLTDIFTGEGADYEEGEDRGIVGEILDNIPKDVIEGFLEGITKKKEGSSGEIPFE